MPTCARRTPRTESDPDRYIRPVKGGKWQARPYDQGVRENLGVFATRGEARDAIRRYWWGKVKPRLRFARPLRERAATGRGAWIAVVRVPSYALPRKKAGEPEKWVPPGAALVSHRVGDRYATAEEAHKAACRWLVQELGPLVALVWIEGRG